MLVASIVDRVLDKTATLAQAASVLWAHPQVRAELVDAAAPAPVTGDLQQDLIAAVA
jgi:hypothetical protein